MTSAPWWKDAVCYQIYPRSFADSNGDGFGDINGVRRRIPYIAQLGISVVWFSPMYVSPQADNGYDIADYDHIDPRFGTDDEFDAMLAEFHDHGIRVVMDLVVNHTSDQHPWFLASRDPASPYRDWYVWRDPASSRPSSFAVDEQAPRGVWRGDEPTMWRSAFSGPTWRWDPQSKQYYLHFFDPGQPDLNWDNPEVRGEVYAMMRRWIDRGVDGFRMDVINLISKPPIVESDSDGSLDQCLFGPHFHEYIQEMRREVFDRYPDTVFFTVGETPGASIEDASLTTDPARRELDMVFQFEHMELDGIGGDKFQLKPLHLPDLKRNLVNWCEGLRGRGWNSLYFENHDQPRSVSRFGNDTEFRVESAKALAAMLHAHQGTPFVYQGQELGMTNYPFTAIADFDDVEVKGYWREHVELHGEDAASVLRALNVKARDHARTPMQWDDTEHGGFTTGTPWLAVNPNATEINAASQVGVAGSVFEFYRELIALRHRLPVLVDGSTSLVDADDPTLWHIVRRDGATTLHAVANFSDQPRELELPSGETVLSNVTTPREGGRVEFAPWEVRWILS